VRVIKGPVTRALAKQLARCSPGSMPRDSVTSMRGEAEGSLKRHCHEHEQKCRPYGCLEPWRSGHDPKKRACISKINLSKSAF
jgi:hypothetical protein